MSRTHESGSWFFAFRKVHSMMMHDVSQVYLLDLESIYFTDTVLYYVFRSSLASYLVFPK